ncbi:hypothetical protein PHYC_00517 [Phycisphaerales bacterium]|nr:hypothetical protein PHYC_00517 [Phycisphaerales bacterium]
MIITADRYPTYSVCKRGLTALFAQDAWKAAIAASHVTHAFMLGGGGSPAKDYELLLSLLSNPATKDDPIRMLLVDINPYMIAQSQDGLGLFIRDLPDRGRLWIQALEDDLLQLDHPDPVRKSLLERPKGAVFVITGNTIGNLSERRFFTALSGIAKKGDLLVVGCGIMDNISVNELQSEDSSKYTDHTILSFVRPGVEYAIRQNHLRQSLDHALKHSVRAEVRPGTQGGLSDVPGSCSVVLTLKADEGDIVLLRSARYPSKNLTAFAARHGWEPICVVPSPMDKQYAQFAFRFGKVDSENGIGERQ